MSTEPAERVVTDAGVMRALAHPARLAVMDFLSGTGRTATATECAEVAGLSPSAMSYHLRTLAKAGLVEQAPGRGDNRERVWRAPMRSMSIRSEYDASDEDHAAARELIELYVNRAFTRVRRWLDGYRDFSRDWYEAASLSETRIMITADELNDLAARIRALIDPYREADRPDAPSDARPVTAQFIGVPLVDEEKKV